jgi:purine-binding chemotaxis protein CheW
MTMSTPSDPQHQARGDELVQLAAFRIGGEEYAIDIMRIKEIIHPLKITKVPKAPPFIEGVVELRGQILPIVDLRKRFELPNLEVTRATKYIIVSLERRILGLVVDAVSEVLRVPRKDIKPPPELGFAGGGQASFFTGVCHLGERIIMILDLDQILTRQEKIDLGAMKEMA